MNRISEKRELAGKSKPRQWEENQGMLNFLEAAGVVFFRTNAAGDVTYLSPGFSRFLGRHNSDISGHSVLELFIGAEEEAASAITQLRQGTNLVNIRLDCGEAPGPLDFTLRPRLNHRGEWEGIEGISLNLSDNNPEFRIRNLESRLEEAEKIKERFLSNISHEIRTPLNGIMGMVQLLQSTALDSDQREFLQVISKSGENLLQTLNQLIDLSLDPGGKLKIQEDEVEIGSLFNLMSGLYTEQAMKKNIELDFQIKGLIPCLLSDEFRIQQLLKQLISNAIRFSDSGQIHVSARLESRNSNPLLVLEVSDTGHGIELSRQPVIDSILQKDGNSDKSFARALGGLGLLTVRMICNALNAEPGFVSAPGKGSTFWIKVPARVRISEQKLVSENLPEAQEFIRKVAPKVLITDDNAVNLKVASEILSRAGCRVILASNGKEAVEKAQREFFHLILMDIQMPVMDGIEASRKIQKLRLENAPAIIAMTAYVMNEDKKRFLEAGMDDFIAKPISGDQLISRVRHWTEKSLLRNPDSEIIYRAPEEAASELFRVFDVEVIRNLRRHIGEEILLSSLDEFAEELREILDGIAASLETRDSEELQRYFHTLKGNAGTFGLNRMSAIARNLENDLYSKDFAEVITDFHRLEESSLEFLNTYTLLRTNYEWKN